MMHTIPTLSYILVLMLTLAALCGPMVCLGLLMEAGRRQEALRAQHCAEEEARRRQAEMRLAAEKQSIAEKFAKAGMGRAVGEAEPGLSA